MSHVIDEGRGGRAERGRWMESTVTVCIQCTCIYGLWGLDCHVCIHGQTTVLGADMTHIILLILHTDWFTGWNIYV